MGYSFYYPPENKVFVARNAEFLENSLITQEASGSLKDLEIIQEEDTHPSIDTSLHHEENDQEIDKPQSDINPIHRSIRTHRPTDRLCLHVGAEEHEVGDLSEPANYKAALLDPKSNKWLNVMNVKIQSMRDNEVWELVDLPPNGKTVDIRAIRILVVIATFYDYEIWQMDVKIAFLSGYLNEEVYMEQPEGFINPKYPNQEKLHIFCEIRFFENRSKAVNWFMLRALVSPLENLIRYFMENSKRGTIPMQEKLKCTRPDVAFTQNITSRFQQNPGELHWTTVMNILKYLRNTKDMFLVYRGDMKQELKFAFDAMHRKRQSCMDFGLKFISGIGVVPTIEEPINMYCDNTRAIAIAKDHGVTKGARHFRAKVHYLRETIEMGDVRIEKVDTNDNLADPFKKALAFPKHSELTRSIRMIPASSLM
ncbi:retrotransposon protein, putative, ty1-copia subclass [Tanacetum coccineum]|uniref:Retrotransposon protein, putative, ty1-copia subclass n=1 Tax=Tanacetum coccineum TaxID=301880 RepID=A0ABQ5CMI7_9ASTR